MSIRGATPIPAANPLSLNPADYPACVAWWQCNEGSGAVVTDKTGHIADIPIVIGALGDAWTTPRAFTVNDDTAGTVDVLAYRDLTANDLLYLAIGATEKLIVELDILLPNYPSHSMAFIEFGQSETSVKGWMVGLDSIGKPIMKLSNDTTPWAVPSTWANSGAPHTALGTGTRKRVVFTLDNEAGQVRFYTSAVQNGTPVDSTSPELYSWASITPSIAANSRIGFGFRYTGGRRGDCQYFNARIWKPANLNNITQFLAETHRLSSDEFPPCMLGVV